MLHKIFHVINFHYSLLIRCFPSSAWETIPQAPLAVTGSRASGAAFPNRAWEGANPVNAAHFHELHWNPLIFIRLVAQSFYAVTQASAWVTYSGSSSFPKIKKD
ncbi:hypothetical protein [Methylotuvimicrobium sp.]|uniref:hypothetical protein n=1 Tax=Methylotuvimicrobium sp. TaxID=2822413 RepID=UPI003D65D3D2